nr:protein chromatin remodeling 20 [Quercus suber]
MHFLFARFTPFPLVNHSFLPRCTSPVDKARYVAHPRDRPVHGENQRTGGSYVHLLTLTGRYPYCLPSLARDSTDGPSFRLLQPSTSFAASPSAQDEQTSSTERLLQVQGVTIYRPAAMAEDPWDWGSAEVQHFFRENAARYLHDRPQWNLPDSDLFSQVLRDECIDGIMLLEHIGTAELKEDLGIKNMRERTAVLHCINRLRKESQGYLNSQAQKQTQNTPSVVTTSRSLQPITFLGEASEAQPQIIIAPIGENVRPGEQQVHDMKGNKRRRLNPTTLADASTSSSSAKSTRISASSDWFTRYAHPVDELFYGVVDFGQIIPAAQLPKEILPNPIVDVEGREQSLDLKNQEDNFQFYDSDKGPGNSRYVHSRIRFFLQHATFDGKSVIALDRHDRDGRDRAAVAILPYREELHTYSRDSRRSATVVQLDRDRKAVAVREDAVLLQRDYTDVAPIEGAGDDNGQWDFLLTKYPRSEGGELPLWGESNSEYSEGSSFDRELADESATDTSGDEVNLSKVHASQIIDKIMDELAVEWSGKRLPVLEKLRAWTVWKKMKGSRSQKQRLIASAESIIARLDSRLSKLKDEILLDQWRNETLLREQCRVLEVSIEDREEQRWMISVWQRKKEPAHVTQMRRSGMHQQASTMLASVPNVALPAQDRLSISPTPVTRTEAMMAPPEPLQEVQGGHSARESPEVIQRCENDTHEPDDMSIDRSVNSLSDKQHDNVSEESMGPSGPGFTTDELTIRKIDTGSSPIDEGDPASLDDDLPSPRSLIPKRKESKPPSPDNELIDLTVLSSDDSSLKDNKDRTASSSKPVPEAKAENARRKKPLVFTGKPTEADSDEVDAWTFLHLERVQDRGRLLIKLLRNMDPVFRSRLHDYCLSKGSIKGCDLSASLRSALTGVQRGSPLNPDPDTSRMLEVLARLFLAWHDCDHSIMERDTQDIKWLHIWKTVDHQILMFTRLLVSYLNMSKSKLFVASKPNKFDAPISIYSSDEDETVMVTPHKKRKREVKADTFAKTTRQTAQERLERFQNLVPAQTSDLDQLVPVITTATTESQIAINPAKDAEQDFININARISSKMKHHQIDGVRFMWREITASDGDDSQGCILAHTMGLGKTMQTIALLAAVFEASQSDQKRTTSQLPKHLKRKNRSATRQVRALVLCPPALLQNWHREIELWAPQLFQVYSIKSGSKFNGAQLAELENWHRNGGIMLLGYTTFRSMIQRKNGDWSRLPDSDQGSVDNILLNGTELVVADEAHTFKNRATAISECVMRFTTKSRIALTGTPMSNHVGEVYAMMNWIAPGYLGAVNEFNAHYREPIEEGQYLDSSRNEIRQSIKKLAVLRHEIEPKVHRADITVLKGLLSRKIEFLITVSLTTAQTESYKRFVAALLGNGDDEDKVSQVTMFGWLEALTLLGNHPLPFRRKLLDPLKLRVTEPAQQENSNPPVRGAHDQDSTPVRLDEQVGDAGGDGSAIATDLRVLGLSDAKVRHILEPLGDSIEPSLSMKTSLFVDILGHARRVGDKVLVFSLKLRTLEYLSDLLISLDVKFGRLEGKTPMNDRVELLEGFHAPKSDMEVLLISTRAGGVGWNITGANRVVIFDFGFNPSDEAQAIGRAYRLGQTKPVYVYRFVGGGTFEMDMHNKQLFKTGLAQRVVDKKNPRRNAMRNTRDYLYDPKDVPQEELNEWLGKDPHVLDQVIAQDIADGRQPRIRAIKTTETFEQDAMDAPLDEQERKEVDQEIAMGQDRIRRRGKKPVIGVPNSASQDAHPLPPSTAPVHQSTTPASTRVNSLYSSTQPVRQQESPQQSIPKLKLKNSRSLQANLGGLPVIPSDQSRLQPPSGATAPGVDP